MMCKLLSLALVVAFSGASLGLKEPNRNQNTSTCPTWTIYDVSTNSCECGRNVYNAASCVRINECPKETFLVAVLYGYCMTLNKDESKTVVGACPYSVQRARDPWPRLTVPSNSSQLDAVVCGYINRTGQLCGQCVNGTSPPVYSYYPQCVHCPAGTNNWAKYLAVSLLPTILFFFGAIVIKLRAASPHMNCYILACQIVSSPTVLRHVQERNFLTNVLFPRIYFSLISIWNLDFLRMIYSPYCLTPNATMLQVLSLDYIIAVYPLVLIILTYTLVTLHYHNCRLVVWLWRPFLRCCIRFQRQLDIRNSLIDAFATFLLLSYVKFLSVSFDILTPTILWDAREIRQPTVLYVDGTVEYFSEQHIPYAILAITVLLVFTLLPILLLCLYPCRCFQRFLNSCHLRSQALHTFMDTFQGSYKDGTNRSRDCRYFAALYLILRVAVHLSLIYSSITYTNAATSAVLAIMILLLSGFQPYKAKLHNQLDILFLTFIIVFMSSAYYLQFTSTLLKEKTERHIVILLAPLPIVYPLCLVLYHTWKTSRRLQSATKWIRALLQRSNSYWQLDVPH